MVIKKSRNTEKQNLVKKILSTTEYAMSVENIIDKMPVKINKTTVYRILDRFIEKGQVHFVTGKNGKTHYALCDSCGTSHKMHNHIHFECQVCKEVTCQPNILFTPTLEGFTVEETQLLVIGTCKRCNSTIPV